jgi:hypothetical protein
MGTRVTTATRLGLPIRTLPGMTQEPVADSLVETAATLAECFPELVERLRAQHIPGPDGRCTGCVSGGSLAPRWPCGPRALADLASLSAKPSGGSSGF